MVFLCYIFFDLEKCIVSVVGGEEGVIYQILVGQLVDFVFIIKDDKGSRVIVGGY